jgi:hypothetical protein
MERGVIVGGLLISGSLLLAMILNASAGREALPIDAATAEQSAEAVTHETRNMRAKPSVLESGGVRRDAGHGVPSDLGVRETWYHADGPDDHAARRASSDMDVSDRASVSAPSSRAQ